MARMGDSSCRRFEFGEKGGALYRVHYRDRTDFSAFSVPTLVPEPGLPDVTQANLTPQNFAALHALGLSQVTLGCEIYSLNIRVSVVD
jgi:hypothetical protein